MTGGFKFNRLTGAHSSERRAEGDERVALRAG